MGLVIFGGVGRLGFCNLYMIFSFYKDNVCDV